VLNGDGHDVKDEEEDVVTLFQQSWGFHFVVCVLVIWLSGLLPEYVLLQGFVNSEVPARW